MTDPAVDPRPDDDAPTNDVRLPHDRDEHAQAPARNPQHVQNRDSMRRARNDAESDIQDTERIGTPNDVPASGDDPADRSD